MQELDLTALGKRVRAKREFLGYSRESLAERLDVTPKFCSDIELGIKGMSIATLGKMSQVLHMPTDYILFGKENQPMENESLLELLKLIPQDKRSKVGELLRVLLRII